MKRRWQVSLGFQELKCLSIPRLLNCKIIEREVHVDDVHDLHFLKKPFQEIKLMHDASSIEKRAFVRAYGSLRLCSFCATDKAYWENQKLDNLLRKEQEVMQMQTSQNAAKEYSYQFNDKRVEYLQRKYEQEKFVIPDF